VRKQGLYLNATYLHLLTATGGMNNGHFVVMSFKNVIYKVYSVGMHVSVIMHKSADAVMVANKVLYLYLSAVKNTQSLKIAHMVAMEMRNEPCGDNYLSVFSLIVLFEIIIQMVGRRANVCTVCSAVKDNIASVGKRKYERHSASVL
jgi:hypothetical protein